MFDIGFWEITLIGVIALLVVGPERLPALARNIGFWVGRTRRYITQVKDDIEREVNAEELKKALDETGEIDDLYDIASETHSALDEARSVLNAAAEEAEPGPSLADETRAALASADDYAGTGVFSEAAESAADDALDAIDDANADTGRADDAASAPDGEAGQDDERRTG